MIKLHRDGIWRSDLYDVSYHAVSEDQNSGGDWYEQERLRKRWKMYWRAQTYAFRLGRDVRTLAKQEPFLAGCERLRCGAKNRFGERCGKFHLYPNGRCRFHGGPSTGPHTLAGKKKSSRNLPDKKIME